MQPAWAEVGKGAPCRLHQGVPRATGLGWLSRSLKERNFSKSGSHHQVAGTPPPNPLPVEASPGIWSGARGGRAGAQPVPSYGPCAPTRRKELHQLAWRHGREGVGGGGVGHQPEGVRAPTREGREPERLEAGKVQVHK